MTSLLDHLRTFIGFKTVAEDNAKKLECLSWIEKTFLHSSNLTIQRGDVQGAPYLYLEHPDPKFLWFGHTDVVPGKEKQFTLQVDGDRALGRGVKDMKGADLTFLTAYQEACSRGSVPRVSILLTSDEEIGGHTPPTLLDKKILQNIPVAFTPDTGETEGIVTELKGALWLRLIAEGKSGHAAMPWKSENPVPRLAEAISAIMKSFPSGGKQDWQATVTPTELLGSDAVNRISDIASCTLDIRFPSTVWKADTAVIADLSSTLPPGCRLEVIESAGPTFCDPQHPLVTQMKRIAEEVLGTPVPILREHGSSDARYFTARGIPAFLYGPLGGDLHGAEEWVSLKSLEQHVEINRRLLAEIS